MNEGIEPTRSRVTRAGRVANSGLASAGLVIAGCLVGVGLGEVVLRYVDAGRNDDFFILDSYRGWALRPGFSGWAADENTLFVCINKAGLRDRERSLNKPGNTLRVAVLGDSYMQGMNVPLEKTFSSFLERDLNACLSPTGMKAEAINFGVSGYGTAQELLTFRHQAVEYHPDVVLLAFYTRNDVYNNSKALNPSAFPHYSPYFVFDRDSLVLDRSFETEIVLDSEQPWFRRLRIAATDNLLTARFAYQGWGVLRPYFIRSGARPKDTTSNPSRPVEDLSEEIYQPPHTPETLEAWRVTEALLLMLNREVQKNGAELWVATLANGRQVNPVPPEEPDLRQRLDSASLFYPDLRIRDFATSHGIPVVTLAPLLASYAATHRVYLNGGYNDRAKPGEGHWNELGNRVAAEIVAARLCSESRAFRPFSLPRRPRA